MDLFFGHLPWEKAASMYVRMQVFVLERGIAIADEFEDDQFPNAEYVVIFDGKEPVATSRLFFTEEFARFTRICVVKTQRQAHLGPNYYAKWNKPVLLLRSTMFWSTPNTAPLGSIKEMVTKSVRNLISKMGSSVWTWPKHSTPAQPKY